LTVTDEPEEVRCSVCNRPPHPGENWQDEWRAYSDGVGTLHPFCPECADREFNDNTSGPASLDDEGDIR
jgi:hypothetical protein